jgi:hypothetical protein
VTQPFCVLNASSTLGAAEILRLLIDTNGRNLYTLAGSLTLLMQRCHDLLTHIDEPEQEGDFFG